MCGALLPNNLFSILYAAHFVDAMELTLHAHVLSGLSVRLMPSHLCGAVDRRISSSALKCSWLPWHTRTPSPQKVAMRCASKLCKLEIRLGERLLHLPCFLNSIMETPHACSTRNNPVFSSLWPVHAHNCQPSLHGTLGDDHWAFQVTWFM